MRELQKEIHENAVEKGWWDGVPMSGGRRELSPDQMLAKLALIHSEVSEAVEEVRVGAEPIYFRPGSAKPEGVVIELADAVIRIMDLCGALDIDLEKAIRLKVEYNRTRAHRHGGKLA